MIAFFNIWTSRILLDLIRFPLKIVDLIKSIKSCFGPGEVRGGGGKTPRLSFSLRRIISLIGDCEILELSLKPLLTHLLNYG
jgi:hypothetical protein